MSDPSFRFLHAGGFELDRPPHRLTDVPEPLIDALIDAPYAAAQRVFDAALEERVDFVVLTGDLVDLARPSPRAIHQLLENFERLHSQGIAVYWAGGRLDPQQDWPTVAKLPPNVRMFSSQAPEELSHFRGGRPVANIVGRSWHGTAAFHVGEFHSDADGLPTIVVAYGQADAERLAGQLVDFWALGGKSQRESHGSSHHVIHYSGSPQGRSPEDSGPHGCTLVHVSGDRAIRTQFTPTDAVRFHMERLTIEDGASLDAVRQQLTDRVKALRAEAESRPHIVTWKLHRGTHLAGPAGRRDLAAEWQAWLRKEFSMSGAKPVLWTLGVELDQPELPDAWFEEDSMLGDFLRSLRELTVAEPHQVDFLQQVPDHFRIAELTALSEWGDAEHRELLAEAGLTGAQLLGAAERES